VIASAANSTAANRLRPRTKGTPASTAPKAISPPVHGKLGTWFAAELDAVMFSVTEPVPFCANCTVVLESDAATSDELDDTVSVTMSANVADAKFTVIVCDPPLLSETEIEPGVIV
jgi:hypothetical protein